MKYNWQRLLILATLAAAWAGLFAQDTSTWIFEGLIIKADPALAPDLQSGWVLSGSFNFTPLEMEAEPVEGGIRTGRLTGGITNGELTVDLYYQLHFEASQVPGLAGFDYQDNDPDHDGRDLIGWFFPMRGLLKESAWTSRWLQIWMADPDGKMIRTLPPAVPPDGFSWQYGWFRLTFENDSGESVTVDGRLDFFGPEGSDEGDSSEGWKDAATRLSETLMERDATITQLRSELDTTKTRLHGLQQMVDLLVEERSRLQEENDRLQEQANLADPEIQSTLDDLTVRKTLLEEQITDLNEKNRSLADRLSVSEVERQNLAGQLRILKDKAVPESIGAREERTLPLRQDGDPQGTITITPQPVMMEESSEQETRPGKTTESGEAPPVTVLPPMSPEDPEVRTTRPHRPRKFR